MGCDCESCIAKYLLSFFNFIFFVLGSIVLGIGIWLAADKASFISLLKMVDSQQIEHFTQPEIIEQLAYFLIAIGAIMFILSFLGYCGAIRESQCLLGTYGFFLLLLLIVEVAAVGLAVAYKDRAEIETKNYLQSSITKYYSSPDNEHKDAVTLMWDVMMKELKCCGVNDYTDFSQAPKWNELKDGRVVPESCCMFTSSNQIADPSCSKSPTEFNSHYRQGCYDALSDWIISNRNIVIGIVVGLGIIQLLGMSLAFCLCKIIDKYRGLRL